MRPKFEIMMILTTVLAIGTTSSLALAGGNAGGGGDAVKTAGGGWKLLDLGEDNASNVYFDPAEEPAVNRAVSFPALVTDCQAPVSSKAYGWISTGVAMYQLILGGLSNRDLDYRGMTSDFELKRLVWVGVRKDLEEIPDEGYIRLVDPVTKKQVAIQKNGVVTVNLNIYDNFDAQSRAALLIHENLLRLLVLKNPSFYVRNGTSQLRYLNAALMNPSARAHGEAIANICQDWAIALGTESMTKQRTSDQQADYSRFVLSGEMQLVRLNSILTENAAYREEYEAQTFPILK